MNSQHKHIHHETKEAATMRILIVDDDPDILASLKDVLELEIENCSIELASNVEQAKLLAQEFNPDIALLDIKIGQDNGLELIPELKIISPDIVCIMMTAFRDNEYTVTAVRLGANDYLYKPIKPQELIFTVTRLFNEQRVKREIVFAEKRFVTVFEQATQWLFLIDQEGCLIDANKTAMDFIGKEKDELLGKIFWDTPWYASSIEAKESIQAGFSEVNAGVLFNTELKVLDGENNWQTFELYMKPVLNAKNKVEQIVVESRNITNRKKAEEEIKSLNESLELRVKERTLELEQSLMLLTEENKERRRAEQQAEKASEAKSEFLSRMSHELRTPMNAVLGFGQLLDMNSVSLNEDQQTNVKEILKAGDHLLSLINEVLDLTEIESGQLEVSMEKVDLNDVIPHCISLMEPIAKIRKIKQIDNISGKGYLLHADFSRLQQVLQNLLSNAVKYNRDNGTITLDGEVVDKQRLRISITDTGDGISKEDIAKLFTSFERLNTEFNVDGTGIGLVITKSLMELMGGSVGVESTLGEGSTFWVELALANT